MFVMYALKAIQELAQYIEVPMPYANNSWEDEDTIEEKKAFIDSLPSRVVGTPDATKGDTLKGI